MSRQPYTLIILCGGQGSRLHGADKGLLSDGDEFFVQKLIHRLACIRSADSGHYPVLISANRNHERYKTLGFPVIADRRSGFQGPLAGIEACLHWVTDAPVVVVPADMPDLPSDLPRQLMAKLRADSIVTAHDGERAQPLCMAMQGRYWLDSIAAWLDQGGRSVQGWLSAKPVLQVPFNDQRRFHNINDMGDLMKRYEAAMQMGA